MPEGVLHLALEMGPEQGRSGESPTFLAREAEIPTMRTVFGWRCSAWGKMITLERNHDSSRGHFSRCFARAGSGPAFSNSSSSLTTSS